MRPALTIGNAVGRRRLPPVIIVRIRRITRRKERDQDCSDPRARQFLLVYCNKACLFNQWPIPSVASALHRLPGCLFPSGLVQTAVGLDTPKGPAKQWDQLRQLIGLNRPDLLVLGNRPALEVENRMIMPCSRGQVSLAA